jgi:hypothetical protein
MIAEVGKYRKKNASGGNLVLLISVFATALFLAVPSTPNPVLIENLNLNYKEGAGSASAVRAQFEVDGKNWDFTNSTFDVREQAGHFVIERPAEGFSYTNEASFLEGVSAAKASGVWFDYAPGRVIAKAASAQLVKEGDTTDLSKLALTCRAAARTIDPIDACVYSGTMTLAKLNSASRALEVSEVDVAIIKGKTNFEVRIGGIGKIKGNGTTTHLPNEGTIKIKVDSVKLGILGITGQFFDQLEKNESETLRVERPFIYVVYKK